MKIDSTLRLLAALDLAPCSGVGENKKQEKKNQEKKNGKKDLENEPARPAFVPTLCALVAIPLLRP